MSGFAGMVSASGEPPDRQLLERMAAQLTFRGPDGTRISVRPGAGFCFTLLRTGPAAQNLAQPGALDGRVWLIGDIRLDRAADLRRQIERAGGTLTSDVSDEELVLRAWQLWGEAGLEGLVGDFGFALWDEKSRRLVCVRDLIGMRPFFYAMSGGWLYFSNTLEALRLVPGVSRKLDARFIGDFLLQDCCADAGRTAYRDIARLPAGRLLEYSERGLKVWKYAEFPIEEPLRLKRPAEYVETFQSLLTQAVGDRLPRERAGIFLSGGLDSTSIAAVAAGIARREGREPSLRAFTVDSRPLFEDKEGILASQAARHLGIEIQVAFEGLFLPYEASEGVTIGTPEPIHDPFLGLSHAQYRQIAAVGRVAFLGYGGDDILLGQAWPYLVYLLRRGELGAMLSAFGGHVLRHRRIPPLRGGFRARLQRWMRREGPQEEFPAWLEPQFVRENDLLDRWRELQEEPKSSHPLHPMAHAALSNECLSSGLEIDDAAWTGVAVEARAPLLDVRLLRFLLRVPPVPWCMEKKLLREAMRGMLPEEIRLRPKTPLPIEPLEALMERRLWSPLALPQPTERLREFVDGEKLRATLQTARGSVLWAGLRPTSLGSWLHGVENREGIRYSQFGACA